jgi:hypothetical protein
MVIPGTGFAQLTEWTGQFDDKWSNALNWTNGYPMDGWYVRMSGNEPSTMDLALNIAELYMFDYTGELTFTHDLTVNVFMLANGVVDVNGRLLTVTGDLLVESGRSLLPNAGLVDVSGMLSVYGTIWGDGNVIARTGIDGTGQFSGPLDIDHTGGTVDLSLMSVSMMGGTLDLNHASLFTGSGAQLGNVIVDDNCDFNSSSSPAILGYLSVRDTLDVSNSGLVVFGTLTVQPGAVFDNGGSSHAYQFMVGAEVYGTLRIGGTSSIRIGSGNTLHVYAGGVLDLVGSPPGTSLTLFGNGAQSLQWVLDFDPGSTVDIQYCLIQDGYCVPGIRVYNCTNGGHNTGFIFAGEPDLRIASITAPSIWADASAPIPVSFTVRNEGDTLLASTQTALRVVADTLAPLTGAPLQTAAVPGLDPFEQYGGFFSVVLPPGTPRDAVYLAVTADDPDDIPESDEANNTSFHALSYPVPEMHGVRDIPGDQGGRVYVSWYAAPPDLPAGGGLITQYSVWRAIDPFGAQSMIDAGATVVRHGEALPLRAVHDAIDKPFPGMTDPAHAPPRDLIRVQEVAGQIFFWHPVDTTGAHHLPAYGYPEPTMFDSTATSGEHTYFQVIAHTADALTFYTSAPDSGYSVDNLAPAGVQSLAGEQVAGSGGLLLMWDPNVEADLSHYTVYRGASAGFVPGPQNLLSESPDTFQTDGNWQWDSGDYYKVAAVDIHGNESVFAVLGPDLATGIDPVRVPAASFLSQNYPNPFAQRTGIAYGLARDAHVSVRIYDVRGRLVRTLVDGPRGAKAHTTWWDGRDARGTRVAAGVYFYRIEAGAFTQTKKMVVVR